MRLMSSGLLSVLAVTALCGGGCRRTATDDGQVSASKQVEQAQKESKDAYDRAKNAQDDAIDQQREAAKAQDNVNEKRQQLAEAEAKAARESQESQAAQAKAEQEGEAAQQQAHAAQQRAAQLQQQQEQQPAPASTVPAPGAQARTSDTHQMQTRSAQSREPDTNTGTGMWSWVRSGAWNSAPRSTASEPTDEVTKTVQSEAAVTWLDNALLKSVSNSEIVVTTSDDTSLHVLNAKLTPSTRISKDGHDATLADIKAGDHVKVSYHTDDLKPVADSIEILSGGQ